MPAMNFRNYQRLLKFVACIILGACALVGFLIGFSAISDTLFDLGWGYKFKDILGGLVFAFLTGSILILIMKKS
jgi:hypothetical protein